MRRPSWRRWLAGAAALTGALAPFAGSPYGRAPGLADGAPGSGDAVKLARADEDPCATPGAMPGAAAGTSEVSSLAQGGQTQGPVLGSIDVAQLARAVADQEDHVSAVELATWLRAHRAGLRVIDVRSAPEFTAFHVPGAEHLALEDLAKVRFGPDETVVLYSETGVHAAQAWVFLRALGHRQVFFLRNGLHEWLDDVMSPTLAANAPAEAQAAFERVVELSRCFGGTPRRLMATAATGAAAAPVATRRRGC